MKRDRNHASKGERSLPWIPAGLCLLIAFSFFHLICKKKDAGMKPLQAEIQNVSETKFGTVVEDPYRLLEYWNEPKVREWSDGQNAYARSVLDRFPHVRDIAKRVSEIETRTSVNYYDLFRTPKGLFAMKDQPPLNQPLLVKMTSPDDPGSERVIVDLNRLDRSGGTSMDWYVPSPDGRLVGVSLSKGGSEMGDVHLFESESGRQVGEVVERVNGGTAGGDMAWLPDGSGFYYTRYPRSGERKNEDYHFYQQLWFHAIGTPADSDRYVAGRDFPRTAEIKLDMDQKTGRLLIVVQYGDSGRMAYFILHQDGRLASIAGFDDQIVEAVWGKKDDLFLISLKDAPRGKIVRLSLAYPVLNKAATIVPEGPDALIYDFESKPFIAVTESHLFAAYQLGGPSEIRVFGYDGRPETKPEQLPVSSVSEIAVMGNDELLFKSSSYLQPSAWYRLNAREASVHKTALFQKSPVDFSDTEVVREFATSKDGTKVPVNIIRPKGVLLNGDNPVWLGGYGGYGISRSPNFGALRRVWIEQGGVVAVANIRGGGEYGEAWHRSGALLQKQNGFDDFAAVMQYLIDSGYTRPERLALTGGSNGGLLMGAMITQHPNLFKATVSFVGIYDMIRSELTPNGEFNIPEYGTVKDPAQFRALFAYSPYHHVEEGTAYPAVLFMTGANDPRVDPMHSRKMTARLQAATSSANPILLRTSSTTGHGGGTPLDEQIKEDVDMFAFLFNELGVDYKPVK